MPLPGKMPPAGMREIWQIRSWLELKEWPHTRRGFTRSGSGACLAQSTLDPRFRARPDFFPGPSHAERSRRKFRRAHARRTTQRNLVSEPGLRPRENCRVGRTLPPTSAAFGARLSNTGGFRRQMVEAIACFATPCGLRCAGHCFHRAYQNKVARLQPPL